MLMGILSICDNLFHLLIDAEKLLTLFPGLDVESLGNLVDVVHEILDCVEFFLALVNDIFQVLSLLHLPHFYLVSLKLLLLLDLIRSLWLCL